MDDKEVDEADGRGESEGETAAEHSESVTVLEVTVRRRGPRLAAPEATADAMVDRTTSLLLLLLCFWCCTAIVLSDNWGPSSSKSTMEHNQTLAVAMEGCQRGWKKVWRGEETVSGGEVRGRKRPATQVRKPGVKEKSGDVLPLLKSISQIFTRIATGTKQAHKPACRYLQGTTRTDGKLVVRARG
jgi:hypothetical protein